MKISGTSSLVASPQQVWDAIHDPAVLARTLPGCESLTELGSNQYQMRVSLGVAAVRGTYDGVVHLHPMTPPSALRLKASGAGAPGTVEADVDVRLDPAEDGGTRVNYDADAQVGGPIGGVGQRMLSGVTKKMAGQFFASLDAEIAGIPAELRSVAPLPPAFEVPAGAPAGVPSGTQPSGIQPARAVGTGVGTVYAGKAAAEASRVRDFAFGVFTGGAIALIGVLVGWAIGRG